MFTVSIPTPPRIAPPSPTAWLLMLPVLALSAFAAAEPGRIFPVERFGAVGDGSHDDGPAIRRAIRAAVEAGEGSRVVLADRTYRLAPHAGGDFQFQVDGVRGLAIEGNGARFISHPANGLLSITDSTGVTVRGFSLDHDPLPFTQGAIVAVHPERSSFEVRIAEGYPLPPDDDSHRRRFGPAAWDWGVIIDPVERHRRWDVRDHFFVDSVRELPGAGPRTYRVVLAGTTTAAMLQPVRPGDRYFQPLRHSNRPAGGGAGSNLSIRGSRDCVLEDITVFSGRSGMVFTVSRNEGRIVLRGIRIAFKPGTDRVVTTWRDGMHCKDNRVGPLIENCSFEGMLDDSINLGANTAMARAVVSPTEFDLTDTAFEAGDEVLVVNPVDGATLAATKVAAVRQSGGLRIVALEHPVERVVTGTKRPHADNRATQFYNMSRCSRGYVVRGCTFLPQRRHGVLARAPDGEIRGNVFDGVGGSAVHLSNEIGSFFEGPFPAGVTVDDNEIRNPQGPAISIYTGLLSREAQRVRDIRVTGNRIVVLPGKKAIQVNKARDISISGNRIVDGSGRDVGRESVVVTASANVFVD